MLLFQFRLWPGGRSVGAGRSFSGECGVGARDAIGVTSLPMVTGAGQSAAYGAHIVANVEETTSAISVQPPCQILTQKTLCSCSL